MIRSWGRNQEGRFVSGLRSSELSNYVRQECFLSLVAVTKWISFIGSSGRNGWVYVEDGREGRPR